MSRSIKKGPYVHPKLMKKVETVQRSGAKTVISDVVACVDDHAGDGGAYDWSPRRAAACAGVHYREHGGASFGEFSPTRTYRGHVGRTERATRPR